jgi:hypothetical protein
MASQARLGIRWTIGDVSERGFDALRLSIAGALRVFGAGARYAVCVNSIPPEAAEARIGVLSEAVSWHSSDGAMPDFLRRRLDARLAEGVAWKFAPLRLFPDDFHELSLDNDCILWRAPAAVGQWLAREDTCLLAEDMAPAFGQFAALCGAAPRNTGIRGVPPGFDLAAALRRTLADHPVTLASELDEQGLQVAALSRHMAPLVVTVEEVSITSPSSPHSPALGACGAHFVGLNMKAARPWYDDRALAGIAAHWDRLRPEIERRVSAASLEPLLHDPLADGHSGDLARGVGIGV